MSIYEEALADAKKIAETARQSAKNDIIEHITPVINQIIEAQIASLDSGGMFDEEDEKEDPLGQPDLTLPAPLPVSQPATMDSPDITPPVAAMPSAPVAPAVAPLPPISEPGITPEAPKPFDASGMESPISATPVGAPLEGGTDMGKVTIDLDTLLASIKSAGGPDLVPATPEAPLPEPTLEAEPAPLTQPAAAQPDAMASVDQTFAESKKINTKLASLQENLKKVNSYIETTKIDAGEATTIKENLYKLFEKLQQINCSGIIKNEIETSLEKMYNKMDKISEVANSYKKIREENKMSKKDKNLEDLFECDSMQPEGCEDIDDGLSLESLFGDDNDATSSDQQTEDEDVVINITGDDDVEVCRDGECEDDNEIGEPEVLGDDAEEGSEITDETMVEISEQELKEALASLTEEEVIGDRGEGEGSGSGSDKEPEDASESVTSDVFGYEGDGKDLETDLDGVTPVNTKHVKTESKAMNLKLQQRLQEAERKVKSIYGQLVEANLLNAKLIYTAKLQREGLTESQMKKIVDLLDDAESLSEAKAVYEKLVKKITEHKKVPGKATVNEGRISGPAKKPVITESAEDTFDEDRMLQLAGLGRK